MDPWSRIATETLLNAHREYVARVLTRYPEGPTPKQASRAVRVWRELLGHYQRSARLMLDSPKRKTTQKGLSAFSREHRRQMAELIKLFQIDRDLGLNEMRRKEP